MVSHREQGLAKSTFNDDHDRLRAWLLEARRKSGLTQVQAAKRLRRPQSYVSDVERGQRRIDVVELVRLCRLFQADPCDIVKKLSQG